MEHRNELKEKTDDMRVEHYSIDNELIKVLRTDYRRRVHHMNELITNSQDERCVEHYSIEKRRLFYYITKTNQISWDLPQNCKIQHLPKPYYITASQLLIKHKGLNSFNGEPIPIELQNAIALCHDYRQSIVSNTRTFKEVVQLLGDDQASSNGGFLGDITRDMLWYSVEHVAFSQAEETISEPIVSSQGVHLIFRHKDGYRVANSN
jgi:uncharacterized membrane-anchored protein YhcB (DUF1043 family)